MNSLTKSLVLALGLVAIAFPALAATIAPDEAHAHVGQTVTVEGVVSDVHTARSGVTFLDMGGRYPHNSFTAVIFKSAAGKFSHVASLDGKTVDVTGRVRLYHGNPEIILNDPSQLKTK
jgi:DNA/RNA endonuclease YhcR with UshA esterase domain